GVEKMTSAETSRVTQILSCAGDWELEVSAGATFPSLFAMVATRHMHQYGTTREDLAAVAVKNHRHGALNPKAHLRKEITIEQALQGRPVAEPLGLFDCSLVSDGAAALLLCARERARERHEKPIDILGFGQASDWFAMDEKEDITRLDSTVSAAELAYSMAGLGPGDIQVAEVHDCFTIAEIVAIEDLGFMPKGEGGRAAREGITALGGSLPVNTSGGLKSKGHPVGATGAAQIAEVALQLRGEAGKRQVEGAEVGLAHNIGGSGATCVVTILKRGF
ncbi:MAG: thiolase domain-containing protein, partial [Nitrospinota bacterium]